MAFDIMAFLGGVNDYNNGRFPRRGGSGIMPDDRPRTGPGLQPKSDNIFDRLFNPNRGFDPVMNAQSNPDQERFNQGIDNLASQMPPPGGGADGFGNPEILVQNRPPGSGPERADPVLDAPSSLGNRDWLEEAAAARENAPQRKGMFGMKGTLRDVVGILGDAFLVQGGGQALYMPQRKMERASDAVVGMTAGMDRSDPAMAAQLNAVERALYENPELGLELKKQIEAEQLNRAVKENQIAQRTATTDKNRNEVLLKNRSQLQRILSNTPPEMRAQAIARYAPLLSRQAGVDMEELGVYQGMTPQEIEAFANSDMNVFQSETLPLRERSVAAQEKNAQSSAIRAARPPAGRAPPQPSEGAVKGRILEKVANGQALTKGEREIYESTRSKGKGGRRQPPALPPGFRIPNQ